MSQVENSEKYEFHELCLLFPPCTDSELEELRKDIVLNGLRTKITLYEGKILDGRNRFTACELSGVEPLYTEYKGEDPLGFVISKNLCRRHLSESQRAMVAAKIAEYKNVTQKEAAESLNVSERSVREAAKVRGQASPDVVKSIERGDKTVHAAVKELKQSQLDKDQESPVETETEVKIRLYRINIIKNAKRVKEDMALMFGITKWSKEYKDIYQEVQKIIFEDE